jgi:hypothetical protein
LDFWTFELAFVVAGADIRHVHLCGDVGECLSNSNCRLVSINVTWCERVADPWLDKLAVGRWPLPLFSMCFHDVPF